MVSMLKHLHTLVLGCGHISLFFTFCLCHSFVPENFMSINIVPLVKNKCGDLTDVNNYRAIALCNIDTKVLEKILLARLLRIVHVMIINLDLRKIILLHYALLL